MAQTSSHVICLLTRRRGADTAHTQMGRPTYEAPTREYRTQTHTNTNKHTTRPDKVICEGYSRHSERERSTGLPGKTRLLLLPLLKYRQTETSARTRRGFGEDAEDSARIRRGRGGLGEDSARTRRTRRGFGEVTPCTGAHASRHTRDCAVSSIPIRASCRLVYEKPHDSVC